MNSSTSSGMLRKNSTYSPPSIRTQRMGVTRRAPTTSPTTTAMTKDDRHQLDGDAGTPSGTLGSA